MEWISNRPTRAELLEKRLALELLRQESAAAAEAARVANRTKDVMPVCADCGNDRNVAPKGTSLVADCVATDLVIFYAYSPAMRWVASSCRGLATAEKFRDGLRARAKSRATARR